MQTIEILEKCSVEGKSVRLPQIQLERKEYKEQLKEKCIRIIDRVFIQNKVVMYAKYC